MPLTTWNLSARPMGSGDSEPATSSAAIRLFADSRHVWNREVFGSSNFIAVPTLGALVEGWVLVMPRRPRPCIGALEHELFDELQNFTRYTAGKLRAQYGPIA